MALCVSRYRWNVFSSIDHWKMEKSFSLSPAIFALDKLYPENVSGSKIHELQCLLLVQMHCRSTSSVPKQFQRVQMLKQPYESVL